MAEPADCVEVTTRYAHTVNELNDAFVFIMGRLDTVGPDPTIEIKPFWVVSPDTPEEDQYPRKFGVVVEGFTHENCPFDNKHPKDES